MDEWPELTIGEVARRAGVATSSIRYYESIGLLPEPERESGQRRYERDGAGQARLHRRRPERPASSLDEIKELIEGVDDRDGIAEPMRSLSARKLDEVEALLERTKAMKGWLEVAQQCGCASPAECALFPAPGEEPPSGDLVLQVVRVGAKDCRRPSAG